MFVKGEAVDTQDSGYLVHKEYLPMLELHLGDTGVANDNKWAEHDIGELECFGDSKLNKIIIISFKHAYFFVVNSNFLQSRQSWSTIMLCLACRRTFFLGYALCHSSSVQVSFVRLSSFSSTSVCYMLMICFCHKI